MSSIGGWEMIGIRTLSLCCECGAWEGMGWVVYVDSIAYYSSVTCAPVGSLGARSRYCARLLDHSMTRVSRKLEVMMVPQCLDIT
jgi:hypothetical protein